MQPREPGRLAAGLQLVGEGRRQPAEDEPDGVEPLRRRIERQGEREPLGGAAWPEALRLLAPGPGVQPRPLVPEAGHHGRPRELRHRADRPQPEAREARPDVRVAGEQAGRDTGRGTGHRRRAGRGSAGRPRTHGRRRRSGEARAGDPRPRRAGQQRARARRRSARRASPRSPTAGSGRRRGRRSARTPGRDVARAGDPGAERREPLAGGLDGVPVRLRREVEEGRLGCEPMGAPERDPPPDAEGPSERVRVDHRPVRPGLSAEDDRAGRPRDGGAVAPR